MKIIVKIRDVYGKHTVYPVCPDAQALAELAGTKTLTGAALLIIKRLGYTIEIEKQSLEKGE